LFEAQLIICGVLRPERLELIRTRRYALANLFAEALENDDDFIQALLYATGSAGASNIRIKTMARLMNEVINAEPPAS
jgi:hypothetical protein